jgi:VCBS repeat protein
MHSRFLMPLRVSLAILVCVASAACGGGSGVGNSGQTVNLGGFWQANTVSNLGYNTSLSGNIVQTGTQIIGTMNISGSPCALSGTISGAVSGLKVTFSLSEGAQNVSLSGNASTDGNSISGTYQAPAGGCLFGDSGTFTAYKASATPASTITSVSVSCSPTSIQVSQTSKCSALVSGTGVFSSTVNWSVDTGSIDQSGNYTAPARADTANVMATSIQDTTQSGMTSIAVNAAAFGWSAGPAPNFPVTDECFAGDFNGDRKTDVACYISGGVWNVALSTGAGWSTQLWAGGPAPVALPVTSTCVTGDFNGDRRTDLVCYTGTTGDWNVSLSTGSGWVSQAWNGGPFLLYNWNVVAIPGQCFAADFDGDGNTDLACFTGNAGVVSIALSTGSGWSIESWSGGPGIAFPITEQCVAGDFDGDGKMDLDCYTGTPGDWNVALSTGSGWVSQAWNGGPSPVYEWNVIPIGNQCFAADFTGDRKTDLACSDGVDGTWGMSLSNGSGWNTTAWLAGAVVPLPMTQQCVTGDFNGDGKADMACWTGTGGGWAVQISTGAGWQGSIWDGGPVPAYEWNIYPVPLQCFTGDFNGDGITDLACYSGSGGAWNVALSSGSGW